MVHTLESTPEFFLTIEERKEAYTYAYNNIGLGGKWFICTLLGDYLRMKKGICKGECIYVNHSEVFPELAAYKPKGLKWGDQWFYKYAVDTRKTILMLTIIDCSNKL